MRIYEETVQEGKVSTRKVLVEMNFKEGKLLLEMCDVAVAAKKKKSSYKTMIKKLEEMPVHTLGSLLKKGKP
jgi:hypothetical protein